MIAAAVKVTSVLAAVGFVVLDWTGWAFLVGLIFGVLAHLPALVPGLARVEP